MRSLAIVALAVSMVPACTAGGQHPDSVRVEPTSATRRARELVDLINRGSLAAIGAYVDSACSPDAIRNIGVDQIRAFFFEQRALGRRLAWVGAREPKKDLVYARVTRTLTGAHKELIVAVESLPPYRVDGFGIRPAALATTARPPLQSHAVMVANLDRFVQRLAEADLFSGTVLLAHNGTPLFQRAYGLQSKEYPARNRADTRFNLGSMNKMFTAVAIAQLVEAGRLSFDDPLAKFLPTVPTSRDAARIQIKHLLSHTSGLGEIFTDQFEQSSRLSFRTVDDMMRLVGRDSVPFAPGSRSRYSNAGFVVLGKVIEIVSGETYFDYVRRRIYEPAGMRNTDSYALDAITPNLASAYEAVFRGDGSKSFENATWWSPVRGNPSGGGYSTASDLLRFASALVAGKLLSAESVQLLTSRKPELGAPDYGFGFRIDTALGIYGHGGGAPGVSTNLDIFGTTGYVAVVLANYGGDSREPIVDYIRMSLAARRTSIGEQ
jgi:CubicO group peptidase (beta-lactamase class C family)